MKKKYIAPSVYQKTVVITKIISSSPSLADTPQLGGESAGGDALVKEEDFELDFIW